MFKNCSMCKIEKSEDDTNFQKSGAHISKDGVVIQYRSSYCRPCSTARARILSRIRNELRVTGAELVQVYGPRDTWSENVEHIYQDALTWPVAKRGRPRKARVRVNPYEADQDLS
jgi:hypothetical protein